MNNKHKTTIEERGVIQQLALTSSMIVEVPTNLNAEVEFNSNVDFNSEITFSGSINFVNNTAYASPLKLSLITGSIIISNSNLANYCYFVSAAINPTTISLSTPDNTGIVVVFKKIDNTGNVITLQSINTSSILIDGSNNINLTISNTALTLTFFNSNWWII